MLKVIALAFGLAMMCPMLKAQLPPAPVQETPEVAKKPETPAHVGGPIKAPVLIHAVEPEFTPEARKKNFKGNVMVYLWVEENGNPSHVRVVKGVGMGLDEKAVESVRQYKFKPAMQDGKPIKVDLYINVNFQQF